MKPPNPRVQRTRPCASLRGSPLTRRPLGVAGIRACFFALCVFGFSALLVGLDIKVKPNADKIPEKAASFTCTPTKLRDGDTLVIKISTPHGGDLGIWSPDDRFYFLVFWQPDPPPAPRPMLDREKFMLMPVVRLNTRDLHAPILDEGLEDPTRVFTKPGEYQILLSTNLETENTEKTVNRCVVQFSSQQK